MKKKRFSLRLKKFINSFILNIIRFITLPISIILLLVIIPSRTANKIYDKLSNKY